MYIEDGASMEPDGRKFDEMVTYVAIGWLGHGAYTQGGVSTEFIDALIRAAFTHHANQMRGYHYCEHCAMEDIEVRQGDNRIMLGSAEIWIPVGDGRVFVAPNLIIHYVRDHGYLPPAEFIDAVMKTADR